jgi:hypothetical protein
MSSIYPSLNFDVTEHSTDLDPITGIPRHYTTVKPLTSDELANKVYQYMGSHQYSEHSFNRVRTSMSQWRYDILHDDNASGIVIDCDEGAIHLYAGPKAPFQNRPYVVGFSRP